jgi:DNA invertase Pin-like site-specific DNA recombinase
MSEARLRALLYARVSTRQQAGEDKTSLDSQLDACRALAEAQGWEVVNEVRDDVSGYTLDRPGLDEVREWAREGRFDLLVAHKQERISRSQVDTAVLDNEFVKAGVRIWTVQEGTFEDTPLGRYLRQTHAFVAEMDRAQRREATSRGQREGQGREAPRLEPQSRLRLQLGLRHQRQKAGQGRLLGQRGGGRGRPAHLRQGRNRQERGRDHAGAQRRRHPEPRYPAARLWPVGS